MKRQVFLIEDPLSYARRKPETALRERMEAERTGEAKKILLRMIDSQGELDKVLDQDPRPEVDWIVVPRVAFKCAYWPLSKQADKRLERAVREGREPTFEEIEGTNIAAAWEIFEEPEENQE